MLSLLFSAVLAAMPLQDAQTAAEPPRGEPAAEPADEAPADAAQEGYDVIAAVNAYLNGLDAVEARFLQINPDGSAHEGDLYLDRPGKARFEYDEYPLLIVSDGRTVAQRDTALNTTDRAALSATPLYYLLKDDVDLSEDAKISQAGTVNGGAFITLEDPDGEYDGWLTLMFNGPSLELREWVATDALGQQTRFVLSDMRRSTGRLDPRLFTLEDESDSRAR